MTALNPLFRFPSLFLCGYRNCRPNPTQWYFAASYAQTAEERLGISKPKKPLSAFLKFANQVRPTLVVKNPGVNFTGMMKLVSKHWDQLGEDVKQKMHKEYEKEFADYKKVKTTYEQSLTSEQKADIKKIKEELAQAKAKRKMKAEIKELGRPKRPMSSFILFSQSEKGSMKEKGVVNYQKLMSEKWNKLLPEEKAVWEKKAQELFIIYKKDLAQWEQKMIRMGNIDFVRTKALMVENSKSTKNPPK